MVGRKSIIKRYNNKYFSTTQKTDKELHSVEREKETNKREKAKKS